MIQFDVITLFPELFSSALRESILKRAQEKGLVMIRLINLRDWAVDRHKTADDAPFGGGDGMVLKPELLAKAIREVRLNGELAPVIGLSPQGRRFDQEWAKSLAHLNRVILVAGRYAGMDQRVIEQEVDEELSIGDYVLGGGEIPALVVIDAVARLVPGVLGNEESAQRDSFPERLEARQYTRPRRFEGEEVPGELISGDHKKVESWKKKDSLRRTLLKRPDLLVRYSLSAEEQKLLEQIKEELFSN